MAHIPITTNNNVWWTLEYYGFRLGVDHQQKRYTNLNATRSLGRPF